MLAFLNHHVLFDSVWRQCINLGIEDIWIAELNFTLSSLCCMNVPSVGNWVSLWSEHLADLSAIAEEEPKEADVLASLDPDRNQQAEHGDGPCDGEDYEYDFERGIALDARSSLSLLHLEQGSRAAKGDLSKGIKSKKMVAPTAPKKAVARRRVAPVAEEIDWVSYDNNIVSTVGNSKIVKDESGQICGRLEPMLVYDMPYRCNAICKSHTDCKRHRQWKQQSGEDVLMADRVLARWLIEGASLVSTAKHKAAHRY